MKSSVKALSVVSAVAFALGASFALSVPAPAQATATASATETTRYCPENYHEIGWTNDHSAIMGGCAPGAGTGVTWWPGSEPPPGTIMIVEFRIPPWGY